MAPYAVHLHLEQRVVQRLLARFRSQGFIHHDLSRACLAQAADSIPRVILLGRLSLYGQGAERLHEELVPVAARWVEPSQRKGKLGAYAREAEAKTLELLERSLGVYITMIARAGRGQEDGQAVAPTGRLAASSVLAPATNSDQWPPVAKHTAAKRSRSALALAAFEVL